MTVTVLHVTPHQNPIVEHVLGHKMVCLSYNLLYLHREIPSSNL